jgi:hypothetical protein
VSHFDTGRRASLSTALGSSVAFLILLSGTASLVGCKALKRAAEALKTKSLRASDGRSEIRVPRSWDKVTYLNDESSIQASHTVRASFLVVITESKSDFAPYTLQSYSDMARKQMKAKADAYTEDSPRRFTQGGLSAIQYEIRLKNNLGFKQRMVHTILEGKRFSHQVILWTDPKNWSRQRPVFDKILKSFRERDGRPTPSRSAVKMTTLRGRSGTVTLEVPTRWKNTPEMGKTAEVHMARTSRKRFLMVYVEPKKKIPNTDLPAYTKLIFARMKRVVSEYKAAPVRQRTINGLKGLSREVTGVSKGVRVAYLFTVVEGATSFYQILLWSLISDRHLAKPLFERITNSFRVTTP